MLVHIRDRSADAPGDVCSPRTSMAKPTNPSHGAEAVSRSLLKPAPEVLELGAEIGQLGFELGDTFSERPAVHRFRRRLFGALRRFAGKQVAPARLLETGLPRKLADEAVFGETPQGGFAASRSSNAV